MTVLPKEKAPRELRELQAERREESSERSLARRSLPTEPAGPKPSGLHGSWQLQASDTSPLFSNLLHVAALMVLEKSAAVGIPSRSTRALMLQVSELPRVTKPEAGTSLQGLGDVSEACRARVRRCNSHDPLPGLGSHHQPCYPLELVSRFVPMP